MARSINIGVLAFHNFRVGEDCIIVRYDKSKGDQTGEKVRDKHILYDNPFDQLVSVFLALGVWFSLESARFERSESLFQEEENDANAGSQRYCSQLTELFKGYRDKLVQVIRTDHAKLMEFEKKVRRMLHLALHALHLSHRLRHVASGGAWGKY